MPGYMVDDVAGAGYAEDVVGMGYVDCPLFMPGYGEPALPVVGFIVLVPG